MNPVYNQVFNSYYQSFGNPWVRSQRGVLSRPTVNQVFAYRKKITEEVVDFLNSTCADQKNQSKLKDLLKIGIHHEKQHQELMLMDIKHIFSTSPFEMSYQKIKTEASSKTQPSLAQNFLSIDEGIYEVGADPDEDFFYDNEGPQHKVFINSFSMSNQLVTNREYLNFVEDKGYEKFHFWHAEAWESVEGNSLKAPLYWKKIDGQWFEFTLMGLQPLDETKPVSHINYFEACAYAEWAGLRLPTEAEWEVFAQKYTEVLTQNTSQGSLEKTSGHFLEDHLFHSRPVGTSGHDCGLLGGLWEWTSSAYASYPGYQKPIGAMGEYNSKFMVNQQVLRGGSYATPKDHIRISYRNFFQPEKAWCFSGLRCVEKT